MYCIEVLPPELKPDQSGLSYNGCTPCPPSSNDVESQEPTKV